MERSITRILEIGEVLPAGTSRIHGCGYPAAECKSIRVHAVVSGIGVALASAGVRMHVNIHQARRHVETSDIDHFDAWSGLNMLGDRSNLVVLDGYVANGIDSVFGVDDVAALEHQVIGCLTMKRRGRRASARNTKKLWRNTLRTTKIHDRSPSYQAVTKAQPLCSSGCVEAQLASC